MRARPFRVGVLRDAAIVPPLREQRRHALRPPDRGTSRCAVATQSRQRQRVPRRTDTLTEHEFDERLHHTPLDPAGRPGSNLDDANEDGPNSDG